MKKDMPAGRITSIGSKPIEKIQQVEILEIDKHPHVDHNVECHECLAEPLAPGHAEPHAQQPVADAHPGEDKHTLGAGFIVEIQRESNDHKHFEALMALDGMIHEQEADEQHQKKAGVEQQRLRGIVFENGEKTFG